MSFEKRFSGKTKYVAPVQSKENEWKQYLSDQEAKQYDRAVAGAVGGIAKQLAGLVPYGAMLLVGATAGPLLSCAGLVGLGLIAYGSVQGGINVTEALMLKNRAESRKGVEEVFRRRGVPSHGFNP